jgi:glycosyltransferase involved in cell wall biosynthesis
VKPISVLYVVEYYPPHIGGAETLFGQAVEELARRGHKVTVVTIRTVEKAPRLEVHGNVTILRLPAPESIDRYFFMFRALPRVIAEARNVDLIHTSIFTPGVTSWITARLLRKPCVITIHDLFLETWERFPGIGRLSMRAHRWFEKTLMRLPFDHYLPVTNFSAGRSIRVNGRADITTVANPPLDYDFWHRGYTARPLRRELGLAEDTFVYLYFGRPGITKGVEHLVEAANLVRHRLPNSRLVMLLSQYPVARRANVLAMIDRLGLRDHLVVLPSQPGAELPSYLLAANVVVVPSISEGFGYSAVEAATIGAHVIATTGHASEEVLAGHATFVPPCDATALAEAIVGVAEGRIAQPPVVPPRFTATKHVDILESVYQRVLERAAR